MPKSIVRFQYVAYASLLIAVASLFFDHGWLESWAAAEQSLAGMRNYYTAFLAFFFALLVLSYAFWILLIFMAARRRKNWARVTFTILALLGAGVTVWGVSEQPAMPGSALEIVALGLDMAAIYFLYAGNSGEWFGPQSQAALGNERPQEHGHAMAVRHA